MPTEFKGIVKPHRWDVPFWQEQAKFDGGGPSIEMTQGEVDRILATAPFSQMDPGRFPSAVPLRGVIQNDTRIRRFVKDEIIVRQGDYGGSAFIVLSGSVRVALETLHDSAV